MIVKRIGRLNIKLYDCIDELPIERYHKFNIYCLLSAGIGNDIESVTSHINSIYSALQRKDFDRLKIQFENYYMSLNMILEHIDTQSIAFACLVHSINGDEITDLSDESLKNISKRITRAGKRVKILELVSEIKKKLKKNSNYISPVASALERQKIIMDSLKDVLI